MKTKFIFFMLLIGFALSSYAQDVIVKTNGEKLKVIVKEINDLQIKFVDYKDPDGVVFTIDKVLVKEVKFHTGNKIKIKEPQENVWYYADDQINNLMFNFSSFGSNTLGLSYERVLYPGQSIFAEIKTYGVGFINEEFIKKRRGFGIQLSYRLKAKSIFKSKNEYRPKHLLHGGYFAPTIGFSSGSYQRNDHYFYNIDETDQIITVNHSIFFFGLEYGKQWILQKKLSIDASIGYHYYGGNDGNDLMRLGNMFGGNNKLLSFNIRIGFLFGNDRITDKKANNSNNFRGKRKSGEKFFD